MNPLVVDLDGTLILTDMLHETALSVCVENPFKIFQFPRWLRLGKAHLKQQLAQYANCDTALIPFNTPLIQWLKQEKANGRELILCTATDRQLADAIIDNMPEGRDLFDEIIASDGRINVAGSQKAQTLVERFGIQGFDYAGNSSADIPVWKVAKHAIVVNASSTVLEQAQAHDNVIKIFKSEPITLADWTKMLRVHQWLKNLLLFVPLFASHLFTDFDRFQTLYLAFVAFSLCASVVYICNDLLDLSNDRRHIRKRFRPFASGKIPILFGLFTAPILLLVAFSIATSIGITFALVLLGYLLLTSLYSLKLKKMVLIDCFTLAMLYTIRIIAGAVAANLDVTFWLLAVSVFLFLSLAFVKRYAELEISILAGKKTIQGRGYDTRDATLLQTLGITAGVASVIMLALYVNSQSVTLLYSNIKATWGVIPTLLFWVSWVWMQAHRGKMHDDPVIFAVRDKVSLITGVVFAAFLLLGTYPW